MYTEGAEALLLCEQRRRRWILDVRAADLQGDGGTTLFRSIISDEDGGNPANIAASGSEQSNTARLREQQAQKKLREQSTKRGEL
jgi:hypothetical protein